MRRTTLRTSALLAALTIVASACVINTGSDGTGATSPRPGGFGPGILAAGALVPFDACDTFLDYVIGHAVDLVGPYGLDDPGYYPWLGRDFFAVEEATALADSAGQAAGGDTSFSGTNVQVEGVDEPDIVKTDGERIVLLAEGALIVVDVTDDEPEVTGRLNVGNFAVQSLFLHGDTALLFGSMWTHHYPLVEGDAVDFAPVYQTPTVQLLEVDITGDPEIERTMTIDGRYISARMVDDTVRLVLTSGPVGFEWAFPTGTGLRAEREAIEENKRIVRNSEADNWIPYFIVTDGDGDVTDEGTLFDCDRASHPEEFSGVNMLSVATIDLGNGLDVVDSTGVLATGETVYASTESLYVATQNWTSLQWAIGADGSAPDQVTTDIHKFDLGTNAATYVASGRVTGYLLNQFAMDEHDGLLRVASTTQPAWWGDGGESESLVTVLEHDGGELVEIGTVDGLGKTEQIYSVRFLGDVAYVVTFRQTDPLYTVDLSDPTDPQVVGELKILGYSAYLHPLGDGLLMGVGQDATDTGQVQGTQVSVFDVSDPANPRKVDQVSMSEGSNSSVEYDHHAFLYWEPSDLAMIPVQQWWWNEESESAFFGAIAIEISDEGDVDIARRLAHPGGDDDTFDYRAAIQRSVVIGDALYTISNKGILKSELDTLDELDWLGF